MWRILQELGYLGILKIEGHLPKFEVLIVCMPFSYGMHAQFIKL